MTALADRVNVARRFRRSIRIDTDLSDPTALEGFLCPPSSAAVLRTMAKHIAESGQAAFTWTGPYGTGKSSLVIALSAALNGSPQLRESISHILGAETTGALWDALPPRADGWRILPVVGRRDDPAQVVGEAIQRARLVRSGGIGVWSDDYVFATLSRIANRTPTKRGGLIVFIDEMGKFLEGATYDGTDIYFFQQLAEIASRSNNRLIVVGILHQAFEEYAYRLSRQMRDEWAKIQGRFIDLPISVGPDEQLELLGRAIDVDGKSRRQARLAKQVAELLQRSTPPRLLEDCWPLHPVTACLLGPISRRRFGQNQRSLFSFLNSTEPRGFQDFLRTAGDDDLYAPDLVWDYLRVNLEPSIIASPDGHRWAMAVDALERCHAEGGGDLKIRLLKVIGLVDLFKERSGLVASLELLDLAVADYSEQEIRETLASLQEASLVIFRKFSNSYGIFEGSDFDIEHAVDEAYETIDEIDFPRLTVLAGLQPVIAKRHYHKTGAIRWLETAVVPLRDVEERAFNYLPNNGAIGAFLLALPSEGDSPRTVKATTDRLISLLPDSVIVGIPQWTTWSIESLARELIALEQVRDTTPELRGDRVARLEIDTRITDLQDRIVNELDQTLDSAIWHGGGLEPQQLEQAELNSLASKLADARFDESPRLKNELLNRVRPSSNAVAAQNTLLRHMALYEGRERLGIKGFPAEGGLFASTLEATGLYREHTPGEWRIVAPNPKDDPCNLVPAWEEATQFLQSNSHRAVSVAEIYDMWRAAPFGIKDGLLPILAVALALSKSHSLAFYRQGVFQVRMTDLDTDYLAKDPADIQLRWMDMSNVSRRLLSDMADIVREMDSQNTLTNLEPIDVARGLVAIYDQLPPWVGRTQRLSSSARRVRHLFKQAKDPNRLIFDDIPQELDDRNGTYAEENIGRVADKLRDALTELREVYPSMLHRLRELLLSELHVPNASAPMLADLRSRAENVLGIGGDHRLEAFIVRLIRFRGSNEDMENLASMATNKMPRNWVDADVDQAAVELADLAQKFLHIEAFARVKGRPTRRHSMAVVVGVGGRPTPFHDEFEIGDLERAEVDALVAELGRELDNRREDRRNIILAALAELSARYLSDRENFNATGSQQEYEQVS